MIINQEYVNSIHYSSSVPDLTGKVNDKSVWYYENTPVVHLSGESDVGQVILVNCDDSIIEELYISETSIGITVLDSLNCSISENTIIDCNYGTYLYGSSNNTLSGNNANYNNDYGIWLCYSSNNTLSGNKVNNNSYGIYLESSSHNNTLTGNNASYNNGIGILLDSSSYTTLAGNTANNNHREGIFLMYSSNNTTLVGNTANNNKNGTFLDSSNNNKVINNLFLGNGDCYNETGSTGNLFEGNVCTAPAGGLALDLSTILLILVLVEGAVIGLIVVVYLVKKGKIRTKKPKA